MSGECQSVSVPGVSVLRAQCSVLSNDTWRSATGIQYSRTVLRSEFCVESCPNCGGAAINDTPSSAFGTFSPAEKREGESSRRRRRLSAGEKVPKADEGAHSQLLPCLRSIARAVLDRPDSGLRLG